MRSLLSFPCFTDPSDFGQPGWRCIGRVVTSFAVFCRTALLRTLHISPWVYLSNTAKRQRPRRSEATQLRDLIDGLACLRAGLKACLQSLCIPLSFSCPFLLPRSVSAQKKAFFLFSSLGASGEVTQTFLCAERHKKVFFHFPFFVARLCRHMNAGRKI